jgi:hypothetical protein
MRPLPTRPVIGAESNIRATGELVKEKLSTANVQNVFNDVVESLAVGTQGNNGGLTRFLVACSNAYASAISFGSVHFVPVRLTPKGAGRGSNPSGKAFAPVPLPTGSSA